MSRFSRKKDLQFLKGCQKKACLTTASQIHNRKLVCEDYIQKNDQTIHRTKWISKRSLDSGGFRRINWSLNREFQQQMYHMFFRNARKCV